MSLWVFIDLYRKKEVQIPQSESESLNSSLKLPSV